MKRIGGAPSASAEEMGARGAAFSRDQGRRTARTCATSASTSTSRRSSTSPGPAATSPTTHRGFGSTPARGRGDGGAVRRRRCRAAASPRPAKHFPGLGAARVNTDVAVQRIGLSKATLRRVDEAPYPRFFAAGGEMVMLSTAIYPAFSAEAGGLRAGDRDRRAARAARLRWRRDHRRARNRRRGAPSGPPRRRGCRRPRRRRPPPLPTPTSARGAPPRPRPRPRSGCAPPGHRLRTSAERVLRLRNRPRPLSASHGRHPCPATAASDSHR